MRRRRHGPRGGIGAAIDLAAGLLFWVILIFILVDLVQIGRAWQVTQNATYDAAQGVAAYGCWTAGVTQVVQTDLAQITLAPGHVATASLQSSVNGNAPTQALDVSSTYDPALTITIDVPIEVGGWLGIPIMPVTMQGTTTVTSSAYFGQSLGSGGANQCETPQA
jgi:hypothetical protein